jgi:hypothetical protein
LINPSNGDTILGGSSTAPTFINQYSQLISVNTSSIFLISMTSSMEIIWHKQYYRDLNDLTLQRLPNHISGCSFSPDNTKIVISTHYLHLIVINKNDGSIVKAFEHLYNNLTGLY